MALLSPGPDFFIITKNSLSYSRSTGIYTALGLGIGIIFHVAYSLAGLGVILKHNEELYSTIQILGGLYLSYLGVMSISATFKSDYNDFSLHQDANLEEISKLKALRIGTLTNILNPKAGIYFISIFTQFIGEQTTLLTKLILASEVTLLTVGYFIFVAVGISHRYIRTIYYRSRKTSERLLGLVLIALGFKIIFF